MGAGHAGHTRQIQTNRITGSDFRGFCDLRPHRQAIHLEHVSLGMNMLLKRGNEYSRVFMADFHKNASGMEYVIGQLSLFELLRALLPNAVNVDMHFSYFSNGNYHFSYKYFDSLEDVYIDHKIFHNHVAIYKGAKPNEMVLHGRRNRVEGNAIDMFMMQHTLPNWDTRPLTHIFGSVGMSFSDEGLNKVTWVSGININIHQDLIIDINDYPAGRVSFGCSIFDLNNPYQDVPLSSPLDVSIVEKRATNGKLAIRMHMITVPD